MAFPSHSHTHTHTHTLTHTYTFTRVRVIVFNATFNHISVISWTGGNRSTREKITCRKPLLQIITSHDVVSSTPRHNLSALSRHISLFTYTEVIAQNICVNMQQLQNYVISSTCTTNLIKLHTYFIFMAIIAKML